MADKKISALTAASTPLAGTEVLPIVQSGATVKVAVSDLTAGRAISATQLTLTTGNLVIGTSGKGIDFSATPGTGTSELLNDYEEGTWTPNQGGNITVVGAFSSSGTYTKVGRQVTVVFSMAGSTSIACTAGGVITTNLPFTAAAAPDGIGSVYVYATHASTFVAGNSSTNAYASVAIPAVGSISFTATYFV